MINEPFAALHWHDGALPSVEIEVRSHFHGQWVGGFDIADMQNDRYLLRRRSDGATLPVTFAAHEIRSQAGRAYF